VQLIELSERAGVRAADSEARHASEHSVDHPGARPLLELVSTASAMLAIGAARAAAAGCRCRGIAIQTPPLSAPPSTRGTGKFMLRRTASDRYNTASDADAQAGGVSDTGAAPRPLVRLLHVQ